MTAYIGCRTAAHRRARGTGITVWDTTTTPWTLQQTVPIADPAWLVADTANRRIWALRGDADTATACTVRPDGTLTESHTLHLGGENPVHGVVDPTGAYLLVANHNSGSISVIDLRSDPPALLDTIALTAAPLGTHKEQTGIRPHQVVFDPSNTWVLVPDKGTDTIRVGTFTDGVLRFDPAQTIHLRSGSGPRHLAFTDDGTAFLTADEHSATVTEVTFDQASGAGRASAVLPVLPKDELADCRPAEILHHRGSSYVSVRFGRNEATPVLPRDDRITQFDSIAGELCHTRTIPTPGAKPRAMLFTPDGTALIVAHERSGTIVRHPIDLGRLGDGELVARTGTPTTMLLT